MSAGTFRDAKPKGFEVLADSVAKRTASCPTLSCIPLTVYRKSNALFIWTRLHLHCSNMDLIK